MGTFKILHDLPKMHQQDLEDTTTGTQVTVTPEDIEAALQQSPPALQVEEIDSSATSPDSLATPKTNFVPQVPTPKAPHTHSSPTSKNPNKEEHEPELE